MRLVVAATVLYYGAAIPFVLRTPPGSAHWATSMVYDERHDTVYMTGTVNGDDTFFVNIDDDERDKDPSKTKCLLGIVQLPQWTGDTAKWIRRRGIGAANAPESCSSVYNGYQGNKRQTAIAGYGSPSVLEDDDTLNDYAFVLDLTWHGSIKGGYVLTNYTDYRPINLLQADTGDVFVAYSSSHLDSLSSSLLQRLGSKTRSPNEVFGTSSQRYEDGIFDAVRGIAEGNKYGETFDQYSFVQGLLAERWEINLPDFDVAGMTKFSLEDGATAVVLAGNSRRNSVIKLVDGWTGIVRRSVELNVRVLDICQGDIHRSPRSLYLVGAPNTHQVTLKKIDAGTLKTIWTRPLDATSVSDVSCTVTSDNTLVYIAGTARVSQDSASRGRMFVAQFSEHDGHMRFSHHVDYGENYRLADVVADKYGNAILLGNIKGTREGGSSIVMVSVDRLTGEFEDSQSSEAESRFWNTEKIYVVTIGVLTLSILISMYLTHTRRNLKPDPDQDGIMVSLVKHKKQKEVADTDEESYPTLNPGYKDKLRRLDKVRLGPK